LEISATPYIFTFKLYDWLRLDLDGKPRPLNIERAFANLDFSRKGDSAHALMSQPHIIAEGEDWRCIQLPTHPEHFYAIQRYEFTSSIELVTEGCCHVMSLVAGSSILLKTEQGMVQRFNFAETFVVPAAAKCYQLINEGTQPAQVIQAYVRM
jgi:hypothetical protein